MEHKLADGTIMKVKLALKRKKRSVRRKTVLKVHKDDSLTHRVIMLDASEQSKFLLKLTNLADDLSRAEKN